MFKQFLGEKVWNYYKDIIKNIMITLMVTIICQLVFQRFVVINWGTFFVKTMGVGFCSLIMTLIFYCRNPYLKKVWVMVLGLLKKV